MDGTRPAPMSFLNGPHLAAVCLTVTDRDQPKKMWASSVRRNVATEAFVTQEGVFNSDCAG